MDENKKPDKLAEIFNLPSMMKEKTEVIVPESTVNDDFEYARKNLVELIELGKIGVQDAADVANQAQHPRSYEALSTLLGTVLNANEQLLKLRETKTKLETIPGPQTVHNTLVINSNDMMEKIREARQNKKIIDGGNQEGV
jgi:hypothetical protein